MTSSFFERLVLSLVLSTAVGICGYYCSKLVNCQSNGRRKSLAARRLAAAPRQSLQKLQASGHWVALCGTAFDVTGDPFFDATCAGIYSSWVNHDVTYLLLQLGLVPDTKDDAKARASYLDRECQLDTLTGDDEETRRRRELIKEWFVRFHSRYEVVAQLSDRYVGAQWEALRAELLPSDSDSGGKCPLGFGAKTVSKSTVSLKPEDLKNMRTISFQGRRYDVTNSKLFHPDGGKFAHFVGHDITYTLAMQSMQVEDLDVAPEKSYTFEEQLLLERYRNIFARTLVLLEVDEEQSENGNRMNEANLHQLIERSDGIAQDECVKLLNKALENATGDQVNAVCPRTMMTPLQKAVEKHRLDLVEVLVRAGADTEERAALYDDETPLQMACRFRFDDIAAYLKTVTLGGN